MLRPPLRAVFGTSPLTGSLIPTPVQNISQFDIIINPLSLSPLLNLPAKESRSAMRLDLILRSSGASLWIKKMMWVVDKMYLPTCIPLVLKAKHLDGPDFC